MVPNGPIYAYVMYKWSLRYQVCNQYFMCTLNLHISTLQKRGKASEFLIYLFKKHLEILHIQRSMFKDLKNILASQCILIHNSCSNKSIGTYKKKNCGEPTLVTLHSKYIQRFWLNIPRPLSMHFVLIIHITCSSNKYTYMHKST